MVHTSQPWPSVKEASRKNQRSTEVPYGTTKARPEGEE